MKRYIDIWWTIVLKAGYSFAIFVTFYYRLVKLSMEFIFSAIFYFHFRIGCESRNYTNWDCLLLQMKFNPSGIILDVCINTGTVSSSTANAIWRNTQLVECEWSIFMYWQHQRATWITGTHIYATFIYSSTNDKCIELIFFPECASFTDFFLAILICDYIDLGM